MTAASKGNLPGIIAVLVAAILWGTTGVSATLAPGVSPVAIGAASMGVGGLLQAAIAIGAIARNTSALRQQLPWLLLGALAVAIYPMAFYGSMRLAGVTIGTMVSIGSAPLLSAVMEIITDELRITLRWIAGTILGLVGMAVLCMAESGDHGTSGGHSIIAGVALGLLAGLTYALYSWIARRLMQHHIPTRAAMGAIFGIGGLLLMPLLAVTGAPFLAAWSNLAVGIYMAVIPMFLGYICFGYGVARIAASTAITITLLEPVVAAALAAIIVGERLPAAGWIGVLLIFACLACITLPVKEPTKPGV